MSSTAQTQNAHLRYVDENRRVIFIQHEYNDIPKLGTEKLMAGDMYQISSIRHEYDAGDTLTHVLLKVTPV